MMLSDDDWKKQARQRIETLMKMNGTSPDVQDMIRANLDHCDNDLAALAITACEAWMAWTDEQQNRWGVHLNDERRAKGYVGYVTTDGGKTFRPVQYDDAQTAAEETNTPGDLVL